MPEIYFMWEVRAAERRSADLLSWVSANADPSAQIFASEEPDFRVVVIATDIEVLGDVPGDLIARAPHAWPFRRVRDR